MAIFNSNQFITKLQDLGGPARNNKFDVEIYVPSEVSSHFSSQTTYSFKGETLSLLCDSVTIPYKSVATSEHRINGYTEFRPHSLNFATNISMTFLLNDGPEGHYTKAFFDSWIDYIIPSNNFETSDFYLKYYDEYVGDILIRPRSTNHTVLSETRLYGCFPTTTGEITYSQKDSGASYLQISLAFERWTNNYRPSKNTSEELSRLLEQTN